MEAEGRRGCVTVKLVSSKYNTSQWWANIIWPPFTLKVQRRHVLNSSSILFGVQCEGGQLIWVGAESIERFIEDHAFSPSSGLAPPPPLPPSLVSKLDWRHTGRPRKKDNLLIGGEEVGDKPNHTTAKNAWFSINHLILSGQEARSDPSLMGRPSLWGPVRCRKTRDHNRWLILGKMWRRNQATPSHPPPPPHSPFNKINPEQSEKRYQTLNKNFCHFSTLLILLLKLDHCAWKLILFSFSCASFAMNCKKENRKTLSDAVSYPVRCILSSLHKIKGKIYK